MTRQVSAGEAAMTSRARGVERIEDGSEVGDGAPIDVGGVCAEGERGSGLGAYPTLGSMAGWPEEASEQGTQAPTPANKARTSLRWVIG